MFTKIKEFFDKILAEINEDFESYITKYAKPTVAFLNEIKTAIDNPIVDFGAKLAGIPMFAEVKTFLDKAIPQAILALNIAAIDLTAKPGEPLTLSDYCNALVTYLKSQPVAVQNGLLLQLGSEIVKLSHDSISLAQAGLIVQAAYVKVEEEAGKANTAN